MSGEKLDLEWKAAVLFLLRTIHDEKPSEERQLLKIMELESKLLERANVSPAPMTAAELAPLKPNPL